MVLDQSQQSSSQNVLQQTTNSPSPSQRSSPSRSQQTSPSPSDILAPSFKKYQRHGRVIGVLKGNQEYPIWRPCSLRNPITVRKDATKRFNREIGIVIAKAERLAEETHSWIMVMGQHSGESTGTIHYTSRTLSEDSEFSRQQTANIVNKFMLLISDLRKSKQAQYFKLASELQQREEELEQRKIELEQKELLISEQDKKLCSMVATMASNGIVVPDDYSYI
ncbi:hypothetical protein BDQ17DRAFT_1438828 [Cyathus striatus]|nr:hypothetical protein BDQ17DRAFT_1438828 [Cyathus striatus]